MLTFFTSLIALKPRSIWEASAHIFEGVGIGFLAPLPDPGFFVDTGFLAPHRRLAFANPAFNSAEVQLFNCAAMLPMAL